MHKVDAGLYKWYILSDYHTCLGLSYEKGIYKDVSECNAGWYYKIGSLLEVLTNEDIL